MSHFYMSSTFTRPIADHMLSNYDGVLMALDGATGAELWQASHDGGANVLDTFYDVAVDDAGNVAVSGIHTPIPADEAGGVNLILRRYATADGALNWAHAHDGPTNGSDYGYGVAFTAAGDVIGAGMVAVSTVQGRDDLWLGEYTP